MFEKYSVFIWCIKNEKGRYAEINVLNVARSRIKSRKYVHSVQELNDFLKEQENILTPEEIECVKDYAKEAKLPK